MTQQEYNQKRYKYFVQFCKNNGINQEVNISLLDAFNQIFDYVYAIGREKETISQEEIEKMAKKYTIIASVNSDNFCSEDIPNAFKTGVKFALGKQEKDAKEKKTALTDKEVYALESAISELESLIEGTLDEDYRKEQKLVISALKRIIKKYKKK